VPAQVFGAANEGTAEVLALGGYEGGGGGGNENVFVVGNHEPSYENGGAQSKGIVRQIKGESRHDSGRGEGAKHWGATNLRTGMRVEKLSLNRRGRKCKLNTSRRANEETKQNLSRTRPGKRWLAWGVKRKGEKAGGASAERLPEGLAFLWEAATTWLQGAWYQTAEKKDRTEILIGRAGGLFRKVGRKRKEVIGFCH